MTDAMPRITRTAALAVLLIGALTRPAGAEPSAEPDEPRWSYELRGQFFSPSMRWSHVDPQVSVQRAATTSLYFSPG
ncbi:MAG: hypothetical protein WBG86_16755, partial [Polyangiales bacterium]